MVNLKKDQGKLQWHLLPLAPIESIIKVFMFGLKKYEKDNWQSVKNAPDKYYDATLRHLVEWKKGKRKDKESKLPVLAHAACSLIILMWHDKQRRRK